MPLTDTGVAQAQALGAHFASLGWRFGRVLVSPLSRTMETAQAILQHQADAAVPEPCEWLREIDHGLDEDRTEEEVLARIGAKALSDWDAKAEPPPGWIVGAEAREAGWKALFDAPAERPVLIVTSNGAARYALLTAGLAAGLPTLKLATGSYGIVTRSASGDLDVPVWGRRP